MPISKNNIENIYPLTPMQQGMLFHALLEPRSTAYFEQLSWHIRGEIDIRLFEESWNALIERHAILRTLFAHEGTDKPLQVVLKSRPIEIHQADLRDSAAGSVAAYKTSDRERSFVLSRDPLLRIAVLRLRDDEFEIVWSHHHIVLDGWSVGLVLAELLEIYRARRMTRRPVLPAVTPFVQFVKWLQTRDHDAAARFWRACLGDCAGRVTVPHARASSAIAAAERGTVSFSLGAAATARLQAMAAGSGVTLAVVLHAIWALLLGRYSDSADVVFGSVVSGRPPEIPGVDRIVGNFINTIPVRARLDQAATFAELLQTLSRAAAEAAPHQHAPLHMVQSAHRPKDGLFGTLVSFANYPVDPPKLADETGRPDLGFVVDAVSYVEQTHYDLDVQFIPGSDLQVRITYATNLYESSQIAAIEGHMRAVAATVIGDANVPLDEIDILAATERAALLGDVCHAPMMSRDTIIAAFERQAARTPDRLAVVAKDSELTFASLAQRANRLAHVLRSMASIGRDSTVAVVVERRTEMVIALLGILKSGGAYVPIEPALPRDRAAFIIADAGCKAIIASSATIEAARRAASVPVINLEDDNFGSSSDPGADIRPSDLAYVIYTSGTTGRPKGVMIEHGSVVNLVNGLKTHLYDRYSGPLRVALVASYSFDASVQQIFASLLLGHTLLIVDEAIKKDGVALNQFLLAHEVDVFDGTPTLVRIMAGSAGFEAVRRSARHALIGGEPLSPALLETAIRPGGMAVSNVYGPTECCVDATAELITAPFVFDGPTVPIGRPLPNVEVYVIGRTGHLAPRGALGEICIAGAGVGRGYLNDETLTAEKFVMPRALGGRRVYRTGDIGRILPTGALVCLGRSDDQVKVRGFRIEIGEIEHCLAAHRCVKQAAVFLVRESEGEALHAALLLSAPVSVDELRAHLAETLPEHMIPSRFVQATVLPRTISGKLDRQQLAAGDAGIPLETGSDFAAPTSNIERTIAETWQAVLRVPRVGIDDNYFSLGGDSIHAIQILSALQRRQLRMQIQDLFRHPTIRSLAPFLVQTTPTPPTQRMREAARSPALTAAQARFFAEHRVDPGHFHHAVLLETNRQLEPTDVAKAFALVRDRHDALRLAFTPEPRVTPIGAPYPDVVVVTDPDAAYSRMLAPFDLAAGQLHRLAVQRSADRDQLLIVVHHLCIDGVSWRILLEDLGAALAAVAAGEAPRFPMPSDAPLEAASKMAHYARSAASRAQLEYWRTVEDRAAPLVDPAGLPPASYRDQATLSIAVDAPTTSTLLVEANRAYGTSLEDLLLVALARAFAARFSAIAVGITLESHGRYPVLPDLDVSRTIGWFTSLCPFVLSLDPARDLGSQIKSMKAAISAVPDHGLAYGLLRYLEHAPLALRPQVSFNYLGRLDAIDPAAPLRMSSQSIDGAVNPDAVTLAELEVSAYVLAGYLNLSMAFNARRFTPPEVQTLLKTWQRELLAIVEHCRFLPGTELTPADLSNAGMTVEEFDDIFR